MESILEKIIARKRLEVEERRSLHPVRLLEKSAFFHTQPPSLRGSLLSFPKGIIAEFKRRSPSKGVINASASVEEVSAGYLRAGASALSILTDEHFFGGKNEDLATARRLCGCPILRKDFTVDEYQVLEAKSIGAAAVLLIAAALTPQEVRHFSRLARSLGMEVLLEIHTAAELGHLCDTVDAVGVNNRNLSDFTVDVRRSFELAAGIPAGFAKISESGLGEPATVAALRSAGFDGFLIGENFMKTSRPEEACRLFAEALATYAGTPVPASAVPELGFRRTIEQP